jgi:hypothetical protein
MSALGQQGARGKGVVKHPGASQKVLAYLRAHADTVVPYREIESALEYPGYAVANSMTHLISKGLPIDRPSKGMVIYHSTKQLEKPAGNMIFEYIGSSNGIPIVRGENHEMYVLTPLYEYVKAATQ